MVSECISWINSHNQGFDMRKEFSAGAVVYFLNEKEQRLEYLVLHYGSSHWDFPKGKIEPGETSEEAALREIKEETGLTVTLDTAFDHRLFYKFKNREGELVSKQVSFYVAQSTLLDVIISDEHTGFKWLPYEEARQLLTYDNAVHLLDIAHAYITRVYNF